MSAIRRAAQLLQRPAPASFQRPCFALINPTSSAGSLSATTASRLYATTVKPSGVPHTRSLTSTAAQKDDAGQILSESTLNPAVETENVSRIEKLMRLGDKLAARAGPDSVPQRMRPQGVFGVEPAKPTAPVGDLKPLPTTRRMEDSFVQIDLLFNGEEGDALREMYVGGLSKVRMGRLMEDFDSCAGAAAYKYVLPDGVPVEQASAYEFFLVTAAVDRMDMLRPLLNPDGSIPDLRISAHCSYATESSLEVFVRLSTLPASAGEEGETILVGRFAMACRSFKGGKHKIAKLLVEGEEEEEMWRMGKEMREGKRARAKTSLQRTPPTADEAALIHRIFVDNSEVFDRKIPTPEDIVFMSDTRLQSASLMHPTERNIHGKVFGGHLMRISYELAYSTACLFARGPVTFVALDELNFAAPVEIGSLLTLDSKVTFSPMEGEHRSFSCSVEAATIDLHTGAKLITNVFHFTFSVDGKPLDRHVLPRSYRDALAYLDGQRRREVGIEVRKVYGDV